MVRKILALGFTVFFSCCCALAAPLLPHVQRGSINMLPYECIASHDVTFWKNKIYLGGASICEDKTVWAIDVSDPNNLAHLSGAGVGCKAYQVKVVEDVLYAANWSTMMRTYDTTGNLTKLGQYSQSSWFGWNIDVSNNRAYVNQGNETQKKLVIMDVSNPSNLSVISYLDLDRGGEVSVRGSYAYTTDLNRFRIINISDELNPYLMSSINFGHLLLGGVQVRGDYAYMYWSQVTDGGLVIIDISDPTNPTVVGQWSGPIATDMYLLGDCAFYPTSGNGFMTLNISDPANPVSIAQTNISWYALELCLTGNGTKLYVGSLAGDN